MIGLSYILAFLFIALMILFIIVAIRNLLELCGRTINYGFDDILLILIVILMILAGIVMLAIVLYAVVGGDVSWLIG